jgi:hypothetical protein
VKPANAFAAVVALGGCALMFFVALASPHPIPGAPAAAFLFCVFTAIAVTHSANVRSVGEQLAEWQARKLTVEAYQIEPVPERMPAQWAIPLEAAQRRVVKGEVTP